VWLLKIAGFSEPSCVVCRSDESAIVTDRDRCQGGVDAEDDWTEDLYKQPAYSSTLVLGFRLSTKFAWLCSNAISAVMLLSACTNVIISYVSRDCHIFNAHVYVLSLHAVYIVLLQLMVKTYPWNDQRHTSSSSSIPVWLVTTLIWHWTVIGRWSVGSWQSLTTRENVRLLSLNVSSTNRCVNTCSHRAGPPAKRNIFDTAPPD